MTTTRWHPLIELDDAGAEMHGFMERLYPIQRSITGAGLRRTLDIIGERIPLNRFRLPTGAEVFDWRVPKEWNVNAAYIAGPDGQRVVDVADHTLHIVSYSTPIRARMSLEALLPHLHSLPDEPDRIPYRASYYAENWGFCMRHRDVEALVPGEYDVVVDTTLFDGHLDWAECIVPGRSSRQVLLSAHVCHPSLANDNLSGVALSTQLASILLAGPEPRWTYRFVFIPTIIGSIAWLSQNQQIAKRMHGGLVVTCVGDDGPFTYKRSRRGRSVIDAAAQWALSQSGQPHMIEDFVPYGYDERNFCSPGFDLPVGSLTRTTWARYPEYHTSADDLTLVRPTNLSESLAVYLDVLEVLESDLIYRSTNPNCEPQLGRRGLYTVVGGIRDRRGDEIAMLWLLNQCDGTSSLRGIAAQSGMDIDHLIAMAEQLVKHGLLVEE